jgi:hypothetical protein
MSKSAGNKSEQCALYLCGAPACSFPEFVASRIVSDRLAPRPSRWSVTVSPSVSGYLRRASGVRKGVWTEICIFCDADRKSRVFRGFPQQSRRCEVGAGKIMTHPAPDSPDVEDSQERPTTPHGMDGSRFRQCGPLSGQRWAVAGQRDPESPPYRPAVRARIPWRSR